MHSLLRWFAWTYRMDVIPMVGAHWVRDGWPADGGPGEQDAWLTSALAIVADTYNALAREATAPKNKTEARETDDDE